MPDPARSLVLPGRSAEARPRVEVGECRDRRPDPAWQVALNRRLGLNIFGEPNVRIVWAPSQLEKVAGRWTDLDPETGALLRQVTEVRTVQRYAHIGERWVLEKWIPPERYGSPADWDRTNEQHLGFETFDTLGAFPHRGDYEHVFTFEYPDSPAVKPELRAEYAEPTIERIERWCHGAATAREMNYFERLAAIKKNMERKEKIREQEESDRYDDRMKQAFYGVPFVTVPGPPDAGERSKS